MIYNYGQGQYQSLNEPDENTGLNMNFDTPGDKKKKKEKSKLQKQMESYSQSKMNAMGGSGNRNKSIYEKLEDSKKIGQKLNTQVISKIENTDFNKFNPIEQKELAMALIKAEQNKGQISAENLTELTRLNKEGDYKGIQQFIKHGGIVVGQPNKSELPSKDKILVTENVTPKTEEPKVEENKTTPTTETPTTETPTSTTETVGISLTDDIFSKAWDSPERLAVAKKYGIENYTGTAEQNLELQRKIKEGGTTETETEDKEGSGSMLTEDITGKKIEKKTIGEIEEEVKGPTGSEVMADEMKTNLSMFDEENKKKTEEQKQILKDQADELAELEKKKSEGKLERITESEQDIEDRRTAYATANAQEISRLRSSVNRAYNQAGLGAAITGGLAGQSGVQVPASEIDAIMQNTLATYDSNLQAADDTFNKNMSAVADKAEGAAKIFASEQSFLDKARDLVDTEYFAPYMDMVKKAAAGDIKAIEDIKAINLKLETARQDEQAKRRNEQLRIEQETKIYEGKNLTEKVTHMLNKMYGTDGIQFVDVNKIVQDNPTFGFEQIRDLLQTEAKKWSERSIKFQSISAKADVDLSADERKFMSAYLKAIEGKNSPSTSSLSTNIKSNIETDKKDLDKKVSEYIPKPEDKPKLEDKKQVEKDKLSEVIKNKETNPEAFKLFADKYKTNKRFKSQFKQMFTADEIRELLNK